MEQKKIWGPDWESQVKQTAFWVSPVYIGQAQGEETKHIKRGAKIETLSFWVSLPSHLEGVLSFACQIKLSCNQAVTLVHHFKSLLWWDRTEEITHSPDISPGDLPYPEIELGSPALQADSLLTELPGKPIVSIMGNNWFEKEYSGMFQQSHVLPSIKVFVNKNYNLHYPRTLCVFI